MAIEQRRTPGGSDRIVATACPFCETPINEQQSLADHLREECDARATSGGEDT